MVDSLLTSFERFLHLVDVSKENRFVDLTKESFLFPSTIIPLQLYCKENNFDICLPNNSFFKKFFEDVCNVDTSKEFIPPRFSKTYLPVTFLPPNQEDFQQIFSELRNKCGVLSSDNGNTFTYFMSELTDNIYEHSQFSCGYIYLQKFPTMNFVELIIVDDGIGIPFSLRNSGLIDSDAKLIISALDGYSTKDNKERGKGLGTSAQLLTEGMKGEILIASRQGGVYLTPQKQNLFNIPEHLLVDGTIIMTRFPLPIFVPNEVFYDIIS